MFKELVNVITKSGEETREMVPNEREYLELVENLHTEGYEYRSTAPDGCASLEATWDMNLRRFLGDHWGQMHVASGMQEGYRVFHFVNSEHNSLTGLKKATLNRIGTNTISNVAGMTQQEMVIRFTPQETADKPVYMLTPEGGELIAGQLTNAEQTIAQEQQNMAAAQEQGMDYMPAQDIGLLSQLMALGLTPEQLMSADEMGQNHGPAQPLNDQQGKFILSLIESGMMPEDALLVINDQLVSDCAQAVFDNRWHLANGDMKVVQNEYYCNIVGHQDMRFQWDDEREGFVLDNINPLNVVVDPHHDSMEDSEYYEFDHLLSLDRATMLYSGAADKLKSAAQSGNLSSTDGKLQYSYRNTNFKRQMVVVRTTWVRYQEVPMSMDEAMQSGAVKEVFQPVFTTDLDGNEVPAVNELTGEPVMSETPRYLTDTDEDTEEGAENWPKRRALLQITWLPQIKHVVDVMECPYWDIPSARNINIPIPYSMYGQGEPQRLEDLQMQINRLLSILIGYSLFCTFPQRYWRASTLENIRRLTGSKSLGNVPNADIPVPDPDYERMVQNGTAMLTQNPPVMPPQFMDLLDRLLAEIDNLSGNVDIRQGKVPSGVESGKAIEQLRTESYGPLAFKSKFTEWMVERIAKLGLDAIVKWMSEATMGEILDKYSLPALRIIRERMGYLKWDVRCEISTGRGSNQERNAAEALAYFDRQLLSKESTMDAVRIPNPKGEMKKIAAEQQALAMASASVQAAAVDNQEAR